MTRPAIAGVVVGVLTGLVLADCLGSRGEGAGPAAEWPQFDLPRESQDMSLCHPVVCGGRLYVRHDNSLYAYDVRAR